MTNFISSPLFHSMNPKAKVNAQMCVQYFFQFRCRNKKWDYHDIVREQTKASSRRFDTEILARLVLQHVWLDFFVFYWFFWFYIRFFNPIFGTMSEGDTLIIDSFETLMTSVKVRELNSKCHNWIGDKRGRWKRAKSEQRARIDFGRWINYRI